MKLSESGEAFVSQASRSILSALDANGPLTLGELPKRWPVTRALVHYLVEELVAEGDVERIAGARVPGRRDLRITPRGRSRLRGWDGAGD